MSTILEDIKNARDAAAKKSKEADQLEEMLKLYPDLKKSTGRWNKVAYSSPSVNTKVNRFDIRHNCGCCPDSPLEIWPYLETPIGNVYSEPAKFTVGEKHWIAGDKPYDGWDTKMREAGIPESIIASIEVHFENGRADRRSAAEDE